MNGFPVYSSAPEDCVEGPEGRFQLGNGRRISRAPYVDRKTRLRARVTPRTALAVAARDGFILPTHADQLRSAQLGFWTPPNYVRETPDETADRLRRGGTDPLERMTTIEWAHRSDAVPCANMGQWDGDKPLFNWGKLWLSLDKFGNPPPAGIAINNGWWTDASLAHMIQDDGERHNLEHVDYSQVLVGVWLEDMPSDPPFHPSLLARIWAGVTDFFVAGM